MRTILILLALATVVGCTGKKAENEPVGPLVDSRTPEEKLEGAISSANKRPAGHYDIPEPGEGWNKAIGSMVELGRRMDERALSTTNALCDAKLTFDDPSIGKLTGTPQVRIQDAKTFEVEFMLPETKHDYNRIKGDGTMRASLEEKGWVALASFTSAPKPLTEKEVLEFPRRFPLEMFGHYTESKNVWASLFDAWSKGVGGYKAHFEEQTFKRDGKQASHYRVYAETTKGSPTRMEVIVDKEKLRPLTIKVEGTNEKGEKYNMFWTGLWKTGGTYDAGVFSIPKNVAQAKAS